MPTGIDRLQSRLRRDRRGISAMEFGLIAPVAIILTVGAYDLGNAEQRQIQLQEAVRAGGAYALSRPTDLPGIQAAVAGALPNGWVLTNPGAVAAVSCSCMDPVSGALTTLPSCFATDLDSCSTGSARAISITATMAYTAITPLLGSAIPSNSATYVERFQ